MFNKDSGLVHVWVKHIQNNTYNREDVPKLSNLQEIVYSILDGK